MSRSVPLPKIALDYVRIWARDRAIDKAESNGMIFCVLYDIGVFV